MKLVKPSISLVWMTTKPLRVIERAGRTCWKSDCFATDSSSEEFVSKLLLRGHHSVIEHASASYRVVCDRGVTHEFVRHRLFSYSQESTRYCNYKGGVTYIIPPWLYDQLEGLTVVESTCDFEYYVGEFETRSPDALNWLHAMAVSEIKYQIAINNLNWSPQQARSVLPNALKTEIVVTGNLREWRHFFSLRTSKAAHPQMREIALMLLSDIASRIPILFDEFLE